MSIYKNKIKGALYGTAIGDAMGATTEFMSKEQIKAQWPGGSREIVCGLGMCLSRTERAQISILEFWVMKFPGQN